MVVIRSLGNGGKLIGNDHIVALLVSSIQPLITPEMVDAITLLVLLFIFQSSKQTLVNIAPSNFVPNAWVVIESISFRA